MNLHRYRIAIVAALMLLGFSSSGAQTVTEAWIQSDANGNPYGSMIAMDSQENVVVTGWRLGDYVITKKYDTDGNLLWGQHFTVPDLQAVATCVLVDAFDNVVITGEGQSRLSSYASVFHAGRWMSRFGERPHCGRSALQFQRRPGSRGGGRNRENQRNIGGYRAY